MWGGGARRGPGLARHGEPLEGNLPAAALRPGYWCVNCGVLRLDPAPGRAERREAVRRMAREIGESPLSQSLKTADIFDIPGTVPPKVLRDVGRLECLIQPHHGSNTGRCGLTR